MRPAPKLDVIGPRRAARAEPPTESSGPRSPFVEVEDRLVPTELARELETIIALVEDNTRRSREVLYGVTPARGIQTGKADQLKED